MSWAQVRDLVDLGWEVGSHTVTHPRLTRVSPDLRRLELEESRRGLEGVLGRPVTALAYPFGDADTDVVEAAREAGYRAAATMSRRPCPGPMAVPRVGVYSHDVPARFALKVSRPMRTRVAAAALSGVHRLR